MWDGEVGNKGDCFTLQISHQLCTTILDYLHTWGSTCFMHLVARSIRETQRADHRSCAHLTKNPPSERQGCPIQFWLGSNKLLLYNQVSVNTRLLHHLHLSTKTWRFTTPSSVRHVANVTNSVPTSHIQSSVIIHLYSFITFLLAPFVGSVGKYSLNFS